MEEKIRKAVAEALVQIGAGTLDCIVEWPADMAHGDFATNAAFAAAKAYGKSPKETAEDLIPHIQNALKGDAEKVAVAGPGFINITLARDVIADEIKSIHARGSEWGKGTANVGMRTIVEYSCPNPFKEMHVGHLISTVIGEAISRVIENSGSEVIRDSFGGDVGPHVAKALWALKQAGTTDVANAGEVDAAYLVGATAYEESEKNKEEIDALNVAIYQGLQGADMELWRKAREVCLESFRELYKILGTKFDYYFFESEVAAPGMDVVMDALSRGIFEKSDGAVIYPGEKKGLHTLVFITSRGTPTYETKDIGLAFLKEERCPADVSIIITGKEQEGHFKVFLAALSEVAPLVAGKTQHVSHGHLRLESGKMSSRKGNVITAVNLVSDVIKLAREKNPDPIIAEQVAVGALKYMILRQAPGGDIMFSPEQSLSLDGDSGPYLQYALVRAKSVIAQAKGSSDTAKPVEPFLLERLLIRYPEVAAKAERERAPHHITQYLTQLAAEWNSFYANERIIGGDYEAYKLAVANAFVTTMQNGLSVLGIPAPEKM